MDYLYHFLGHGKDLNTFQMCNRGIVIFLFALILIRISGRRSFGIRTPLDNIIVILLGTILGRAIVGVSPFVPIIATSLIIVLAHRSIAWMIVHFKWFGELIEGKKIILFKDGQFIQNNLSKGLVCEEDVLQGVRKSALIENLDKIDKIYIERNGEISTIKKNSSGNI